MRILSVQFSFSIVIAVVMISILFSIVELALAKPDIKALSGTQVPTMSSDSSRSSMQIQVAELNDCRISEPPPTVGQFADLSDLPPQQYVEPFRGAQLSTAHQAGGGDHRIINQEFTTLEDTSFEFSLGGIHVLTQPITVTWSSGGPIHGQLSGPLFSGGLSTTVVYSPNPNYSGDDCIRFYMFDGVELSILGAVHITIEPVNDAPIAANTLAYAANEDEPLIVPSRAGLLTEKTFDPDVGDYLQVSADDRSMWGAEVAVQPNGEFSYDPSVVSGLQALSIGQIVSDTFAYTVTDTSNLSDTALVTLWVEGRNDPPIATDDLFTITENTTLITTISLLENDSDIDVGSQLRLHILPVQLPQYGTVILPPSGAWRYTPADNFVGREVFHYSVCDNGVPVLCDDGTVTVSVVRDSSEPIVAGAGIYLPLVSGD